MISILIINAVYSPEPVVSAQIGRDLAGYLVQEGARVKVLCPYPSRPFGVNYVDFQFCHTPRVEWEDGVEVVRLPSFRAPQSRLLARMYESFSFGWHVCRHLEQQLANVDVVYVNAWPLLSQALIARHCARRGIRLVLHIQDIYPEALMGKLPLFSYRMVASPLIALDRWIAQQAARVVVISENMRRTYVEGRGLVADNVVTVPDWTDESLFTSVAVREEACVQQGIPAEPFTFLYLGNIGPVAGVELLVEAFHKASLKGVQLVIGGDGSAKATCVERARSLGTAELRFLPCTDVRKMPALQSMAHVCLLPMRKGAGMSSIPSKLMAYLLSAKPVLASVDSASDTARCIREAQCGWVGDPENVGWLAGMMAKVASLSSADLVEMGQRGRAYGMKHFSKAEGVKKLANIILDVSKCKE